MNTEIEAKPAPRIGLGLTCYRVHRDDGQSYLTQMAAGVTLAQARAYFIGSTQYSTCEVRFAKVTDVTEAGEDGQS